MDIMSAVDNIPDSCEIKKSGELPVFDFFPEHVAKKRKWIASEADALQEDSSENSNSSMYDKESFYSKLDPTTSKPYFEDGLDVEYDLLNNPFMSRALDITTIIIEADGYEDEDFTRLFKPTMAHQVFGHEEIITGYRNLLLRIRILPNSFHAKLDVNYEEVRRNVLRGEVPDDIPAKFNEWFPQMIFDNDEFNALKKKENLNKIFGRKIATYSTEDGGKLFINICDIREAGFIEFHTRFQGLIVFFIDAASQIQFDDKNWFYFYVYKEIHAIDKPIISIPIGFCTVYEFLMSAKARIAQLFILPNFQMQGIGTKLLAEVYKHFNKKDSIKYITVESPCAEFTTMRDKLDLKLLLDHQVFSKDNVLKGYSRQMETVAQQRSKICNTQVKHLYYILYCFYTKHNLVKYNEFINYFKKEVHLKYKKKLSRINSNVEREEQIIRIKRIVEEGYLMNRRIHRETKIFIKSIRPQLQFLDKFFN